MAVKPRKPLVPPPPPRVRRFALPIKAGLAVLVLVALGWAGYTFLYLDWRARGANEKALQALVLARHPAERVVLEALAKGYVNAHLPVSAEKWLSIWIGRFPEDWLPHLLRGEIMAGFNSAAEARGEYLRVLELRSRHPTALQRLGQLELNANRNPQAAAGYFAALLEVRPDDPDGLFEIGRAHV